MKNKTIKDYKSEIASLRRKLKRTEKTSKFFSERITELEEELKKMSDLYNGLYREYNILDDKYKDRIRKAISILLLNSFPKDEKHFVPMLPFESMIK